MSKIYLSLSAEFWFYVYSFFGFGLTALAGWFCLRQLTPDPSTPVALAGVLAVTARLVWDLRRRFDPRVHTSYREPTLPERAARLLGDAIEWMLVRTGVKARSLATGFTFGITSTLAESLPGPLARIFGLVIVGAAISELAWGDVP
jgi:hypothetical protein